ncbi:MAG: hypothetical protein LBL41_00500 [Bifidobacteriaceae bacterium]|jgi:PTS system cellobiose-specific IIB component|nr:hypothetical protein [Bifidobacteriaceae bacterium]
MQKTMENTKTHTKIRLSLLCPAQTSTRILVDRINAASNDYDYDVDVILLSPESLDEEIISSQPDVLFIGPQVFYLEKQVKRLHNGDFPIEIVNRADYGSMNGDGVLRRAIELVDEFQEA